MKKKLLSLLVIVFTLLTLTACKSSEQSSKNNNLPILTIGTNAEFAPFEYINNDGEIDGFDIALMRAIGNEIGYNIEFKNMEFKSLLGALSTNGIDAVISGMTITNERAQSVAFSDPYYNATQYIIVSVDSNISSIEELNGKRIAVQEGTTGDLICTPDTNNSIITDNSTTVKRFKKGSDAILELKNGGVDAVVIDSSPAEKYVAANSQYIKYIPDTTSFEEYAIATTKDNNELLIKINEALATIKENGTYDNLINEYINNTETSTISSSTNFIENIYAKIKFVFIDTNGYVLLLKGLWVTIYISIAAVLLGTILGFLLALMKLSEIRKNKKTLMSRFANIYIDVIRGTPAMVQLLIMYMVIFRTKFGVLAAILTFGINSGAYVAEIIRAGILAVDKGQMEAGRSLGFSYNKTMELIILPQAIKNILPALCNEFITLIKETAIVGYVAIQDLTKASDFIISRTYETFLPLIAIAIIYYLLIKILAKLFYLFERRLNKSDIR